MKNKTTMVVLVAVLVITLAGGLLVGCAKPQGTAEPIKIGAIHSMSGPGQPYGIPFLKSCELAAEEINAAGGVLGRKLEVLIRDDKSTPEAGLLAAKDLVYKEGCQFLTGTVMSNVALAISDFAKQEKVLWLVGNAQSTAITADKGHRYVFRLSSDTMAYARASAYAASLQPYTKWYTLVDDYEAGHRMRADFWESMAKVKPDAKNIADAYYKVGTADFTPYITAILASGAEAVFNRAWGADWLAFIKQARPMGYFDKVFDLGPDHGNIEVLQPLGKECPAGLWGGSHFAWWAATTQPGKWPAIDSERTQNFVKTFASKTGMVVGLGAAGGHACINAIAQAIEKAGTTDVEKVIDTLEVMEVDTMVGKVKFNKFHQALWPFWVGKVAFVPAIPDHAVLVDMALPDDLSELYLTEAEVMKARAAVK